LNPGSVDLASLPGDGTYLSDAGVVSLQLPVTATISP
jgi:hypothetical protein